MLSADVAGGEDMIPVITLRRDDTIPLITFLRPFFLCWCSFWFLFDDDSVGSKTRGLRCNRGELRTTSWTTASRGGVLKFLKGMVKTNQKLAYTFCLSVCESVFLSVDDHCNQLTRTIYFFDWTGYLRSLSRSSRFGDCAPVLALLGFCGIVLLV